MHLVKDDPLDIPDQICATVEHTAENLSCHDETTGVSAYLQITSYQAYIISKLILEIPIFLVGQSFDRTGIDGTGAVFTRQGNGILRADGLSSGRVSGYKNTFRPFEPCHRLLLEVIELEGIPYGWIGHKGIEILDGQEICYGP